MQLTENTLLAEVLDADATGAAEAVFRSLGMHCLGCPASRAETLGEACEVHRIDPQLLIERLQHIFSPAAGKADA